MSAKPTTAIFVAVLPVLCSGAGVTQPPRASITVEGAAAATAPAGYAPAPSPAQILLQQAIVAMESRRSVAARFRQSARLFGQELLGSGIYLEQPSAGGLQFRLELKIQAAAGKEPTSLLRVCDGRYLWTYRQVRGTESLSRVDAGRIAQGLEEVGRMPQPGMIGDWPGLGGLPKLLRGLHAYFDFSIAQPVQLRDQLPAWRLCGSWKADRLAAILSSRQATAPQGKVVELDKFPRHLPSSVVLFLGRDDLFPYRLEYWREGKTLDPARFEEGRAGQGGAGEILVAIDWFEVQFNVPIQPTRFTYNPGARPFSDDTRALLQRLGLK